MNLTIKETQVAIKEIKTLFESSLSQSLKLLRVSAPKFIKTNTDIQDDLANTCTSVKFSVPYCGFDVEIVHSLAKWKRIALGKYGINQLEG
jgi:aspartate--ammonia ligase